MRGASHRRAPVRTIKFGRAYLDADRVLAAFAKSILERTGHSQVSYHRDDGGVS